MIPLFPPDRVNYILRTYLPPWKDEERLAEIVRFCKETGTRHVMLFPDNHFIAWNQMPLDEVRQEAARMSRHRERLAAEGIRIGINSSYNQSANRWDHRGHLDYDYWATCADGSCDHNLPCLLDPKLEIYLRAFYTLLAEIQPDYIFVDDDHRYMLQGSRNTWGCLCDLHLGRFGVRTGRTWTRESLTDTLAKDPDVRADWIDLLGERLYQLAKLIADTVHAVNPNIEVGLMETSVHIMPTMGYNLRDTLRALDPVRSPLVRPCIGPYFDTNRNELFPGLFYMEHAAHELGAGPCYVPEVDFCTGSRFSKSMRVVRLHIMQGLLNRMNCPAISANGYTGDTPFLETAVAPMLRDNRKYFEAVRRLAPAYGTRKGIQFIWHFDSARKARRPIQGVTDLYWPAFTSHDIFGHQGFATTYDESPVRFLAGESVRCLDRDRIETILRGGAILDVNAARALDDMGFGDRLGCKVGDALSGFQAERLVAADICGPYTNTFIPLLFAPTDGVFRLEPAPGARAVSEITDTESRPLAPGVVLFQNATGGRIAVLPFTVMAVAPGYGGMPHLICYHRRHMLKAIVDWMNPAALPVWVETPSLVAVQSWDSGERLTVCLINLSYDPAESVTVLLPGDLAPEDAFVLNPKGRLVALEGRISREAPADGKARWTIRASLAAFDPFLMFVNAPARRNRGEPS